MNKRILILVVFAIALLAMAIPGVALAHTNTANDVTACNPNAGTLVLNVSFAITNDADSGTTTQEWAVDTINRTVQVRQEVGGSFCATVADQGTFVTVKGASPGASYDVGGTVDAGVTGTLSGGYTETFNGFLRTASLNGHAFSGDIGTFDYQCTAKGECNKFDWLANYFSEVTNKAMPQWGWTYHTACNDANGTWTNALSGNTGDITGALTTCVTPTPTPKPVPPTPTPAPPVTPKLPKTGSDPA